MLATGQQQQQQDNSQPRATAGREPEQQPSSEQQQQVNPSSCRPCTVITDWTADRSGSQNRA